MLHLRPKRDAHHEKRTWFFQECHPHPSKWYPVKFENVKLTSTARETDSGSCSIVKTMFSRITPPAISGCTILLAPPYTLSHPAEHAWKLVRKILSGWFYASAACLILHLYILEVPHPPEDVFLASWSFCISTLIVFKSSTAYRHSLF